jgi:hypothetical protein
MLRAVSAIFSPKTGEKRRRVTARNRREFEKSLTILEKNFDDPAETA